MKVRPDIKFYDSSTLSIAMERGEPFIISSISLDNTNIQLPQNCTVVNHIEDNETWIIEHGYEITDDMKILSDAIMYDKSCRPDEVIFVTNNSILQSAANLYFGDRMIEYVEEG